MAVPQQPPLNYEASAAPTNLQISSSLPDEVVACLKNTRFVSCVLHDLPTFLFFLFYNFMLFSFPLLPSKAPIFFLDLYPFKLSRGVFLFFRIFFECFMN
jgi:hypothetical protein